MPTLPAPLAARAERWFGRAATVTAAEQLSPGLRRVSFACPDLAGRPWPPGQEIEFRVTDREFRHYTACAVDARAGTFDVVFGLHATGPGTAWARALVPGAAVGVMGPGGGVRRGQRELLLGDATTIGLFAALLPDSPSATGAVEIPTPDVAAATALLPSLDVVTAGPEPGQALRTWLHRHLPAVTHTPVTLPDRACLAGHAQTIQQLRTRLRLTGLPRSAITTKAYWATGRRGL